MTTRYYLSSDAGAPAYTPANASSFIAVLDACLVNGFGAKAAAGWSKAHSATNVAVYQPGGTGDRPYLRVDNSGAPTVRGYVNLTDAINNTAVNGFPRSGQASSMMTSGSNQASGAAWVVVADEQACYVTVFNGTAANITGGIPSSNNSGGSFAFGKFKSYVSGDVNNWFIFSSDTSNDSDYTATGGLGTSSIGNHYLLRNALGDATPQPFAKHFLGNSASVGRNSTGYTYPDVHTAQVRLQGRVRVLESVAGSILWRGELPGLAFPISDVSGRYLLTLNGTGELSGKTFIILPVCRFGATQLWAYDLGEWEH